MNTLVIQGASGLVGTVVAFTFGGWSDLLSIFLVVILIDYVTGVLAAIKDRSGLNSKIGFWGITRKALMFIVILLAHQMDILLGQDLGVVKSGAIYFYMANELISITENYGRLGLPLPNKVTRIIKILKNKDTSDDGKNQS
ncbi:phage holin family protein [Paenibacillus antarcticus]|uniref:Holin n=1 Tax=Paenibacillus antarcticus TaxID=253703 RepID=A0A168LXA9_9BACL|nr:phage holin family protein [Paenibacillus antarcticus]OAB43965.1 holin [Paenibacillus antarcticus]